MSGYSKRGQLCQETWPGFGPPDKKVVPPARFQRATFRLGGGRSMQLSYGSKRVNSIQQTADSKKAQAPFISRSRREPTSTG